MTSRARQVSSPAAQSGVGVVFVGAFLEESTEYAVGDRYSRRAQEGAEPGDSEATADENTTVLLTITINGHSDATNVVLANELTVNGGLVSVSEFRRAVQ